MSEAPERIMAYGEINSKWGVQFKCNPMPMQGMPPFPYTEYVRADRIEELQKACAEWAEVSQSNYQRAKSAEAKLADTAIRYKKRCEVLEERWEAACQDAREAEAKLAQAQTWQPIETAPKDGTKFFAYWPDDLGNGFAYVVTTWFGPSATGSELVFQTAFEWADESNNPTHWMPHAALPAPPSQN
jgi:hypothetical protein